MKNVVINSGSYETPAPLGPSIVAGHSKLNDPPCFSVINNFTTIRILCTCGFIFKPNLNIKASFLSNSLKKNLSSVSSHILTILLSLPCLFGRYCENEPDTGSPAFFLALVSVTNTLGVPSDVVVLLSFIYSYPSSLI